jgi:ketosteroid isomerase-like protein
LGSRGRAGTRVSVRVRGHRGAYLSRSRERATLFGDLADAWDSFHVEIEDSVDLGGDRVLTSARYQGRGKASRAETEAHIWAVNVVRDGKVVSARTYLNRADALEAAGLSE